MAKLVLNSCIGCFQNCNTVLKFGGVFGENGRKQPDWKAFLGINRGFRDIKSIKTKTTKLVSPW